ncbi:reverse transcriptase-like protein, partial [Trifolium medium]|nr:reverse transcriptase-like protein [Trifolium medium]
AIFSLVTDRVWKKLKGWKEKALSQAGKEVLIKVGVQAIPNYVMSCYKLPDGCCDEIERMIARFWWGSQEGSRKMHWLIKVKELWWYGFQRI